MGTPHPTRPRKTFQLLKKIVDSQLKQKTQPKTENDAIPASLSPCHPHCSCARKAKTYQGGGRLRQRVRSGRAGVQQGQGGRQVVQDRRRRGRQDLAAMQWTPPTRRAWRTWPSTSTRPRRAT